MDNEKALDVANDGHLHVHGAASDQHIRSEKGPVHNIHDGVPAEILDGHLVELEVDLARVIAEDDVEGDWDADTSPFPAVRAVVPEYDDTEMPVNTFRAWFLGIVSGRCGEGRARRGGGGRRRLLFYPPLPRASASLTKRNRYSSSSALPSTSSSPFAIPESTSSRWSPSW